MKDNKPRSGYTEPCIEIIHIHENDLIQTSDNSPKWDEGVLDDDWT